jgi:hypothetical protein
MNIFKKITDNSRHAAVLCIVAAAVMIPATGACEKPVHMQYPAKLFSLDTGYILGNGANVKVGLGETGFGIRDRVQLTTNTLLDITTMVNFQVKGALVTETDRRPALAVQLGYYNLAGSDMAIDYVVERALEDKNADLSSGLEIMAANISLTKGILPGLRVHFGYQYKYVDGYSDSNEPLTLDSEGDSISVDAGVKGQADHRSFLGAVDLDASDHVKLIAELGFDLTYGEVRGGAGARFGLFNTFAVQLGVVWPGVDLDERVRIPVMPHLSLFWRF